MSQNDLKTWNHMLIPNKKEDERQNKDKTWSNEDMKTKFKTNPKTPLSCKTFYIRFPSHCIHLKAFSLVFPPLHLSYPRTQVHWWDRLLGYDSRSCDGKVGRRSHSSQRSSWSSPWRTCWWSCGWQTKMIAESSSVSLHELHLGHHLQLQLLF